MYTKFIYLVCLKKPNAGVQQASYEEMLEMVGNLIVTVWPPDMGGDKLGPYLNLLGELNL